MIENKNSTHTKNDHLPLTYILCWHNVAVMTVSICGEGGRDCVGRRVWNVIRQSAMWSDYCEGEELLVSEPLWLSILE